MMTLQFEDAWDKTIALADREVITERFEREKNNFSEGLHFSFIKEATNYKNERLITVLIFNKTESDFHIENTNIGFLKNDEPVMTASFTLPVPIQSHTAMPWTFIFSKSNSTNATATYKIIR